MSIETEIIERVFGRRVRAVPDVRVGIGDDAAITVCPPGCELVTATDALVCGTHFLADAPARSVGHRCLAVNLSDIAAMAAKPLWSSLALSLPEASNDWVAEFAEGYFGLSERYGVTLVGGDTVRGPLFASVTVQGVVPSGGGILRTGARPGDGIYVTGYPGAAAAGRLLAAGEYSATGIDAADARALQNRFYFPEPRLRQASGLGSLASSMIDISDGLATDLGRLLAASGVGARLDVARLPLSPSLLALTGAEKSLEHALCGGEDYELLFTVPAGQAASIERLAAGWDCGLTCLGAVSDHPGLHWLRDGEPFTLPDSGFEHFA
jgi:thiamine-monophosphate kinase